MADNPTEDIEPKVVSERESVSLSDRLTAQTEKLSLQEKEIRKLRQELDLSRRTIETMEMDSTCERKRLREELLTHVQKCRQLEDNKRELEENISLYKDQNKVLHLSYQHLEAKCMELEEELGRADKQNDGIEQIRKDNSNLKTQVLVLSELYQGLKDRIAVINKNATNDEFAAIETELRNKEIADLKSKLETAVHQMEAFKVKSKEIEDMMTKKDQIVTDQKNIIENNKLWHKKQLQAAKQRQRSLENINRNLVVKLLYVYRQLGLEHEEQQIRHRLDLRDEYQPREEPRVGTLEQSSYANGNHS